ncbi:MAG: nucleoid-associated protein [Bulleidia sp.]
MSELIVHRAILHVYDFLSGNIFESKRSLNLEDAGIDGYIRGMVKRCHYDMRLSPGHFHEASRFLNMYEQYQKQESTFVEYTAATGSFVSEFLKSTAEQSYDILFAEYSVDEVPYLGMYLLENRKEYTHFVGSDSEGNPGVTIVRQACVLPSGSRKISAFALINAMNRDVQFTDEVKWTMGDVQVMKEMILECDSTRSHKEILQEVEEVVKEVAEKCDENPTILLSRYKNYVKDTMAEADTVKTEDLAVHVFNQSEDMQNTFLSASLEHELPKEVSVPAASLRTTMKNQKIRTDTGIELTFPTEYFQEPDKIAFINHPDGTISIEIRNIGKIINRK